MRLLLQVPVLAHCQISNNLLAIESIGTAHHGSLADCWIAQKRLFNFARRDIFTSAIDYLAQTAFDEEIPIFIEIPEISSAEPAVLKRLSSLVVLVPLNHAGTRDADFANLAARYIAQFLLILRCSLRTNAQRDPCRQTR